MSEERFASVWDAIEDTREDAENMKLRSQLMMSLKDHIARTGMSQADGSQVLAEVHWYEAHGIGKVKMKVKRWL